MNIKKIYQLSTVFLAAVCAVALSSCDNSRAQSVSDNTQKPPWLRETEATESVENTDDITWAYKPHIKLNGKIYIEASEKDHAVEVLPDGFEKCGELLGIKYKPDELSDFEGVTIDNCLGNPIYFSEENESVIYILNSLDRYVKFVEFNEEN